MAIVMSNAAVKELAALYSQEIVAAKGAAEDQFELVKELCTFAVRTCGIWQATEDLALLGSAIIAAKAMYALGEDEPDDRIDHHALAPAKRCCAFNDMRFLDPSTRIRVAQEAKNASAIVCEWLWEECVGSNAELFEVLSNARLAMLEIARHCDVM